MLEAGALMTVVGVGTVTARDLSDAGNEATSAAGTVEELYVGYAEDTNGNSLAGYRGLFHPAHSADQCPDSRGPALASCIHSGHWPGGDR